MAEKEPRVGFTVFWTKQEIAKGWPKTMNDLRENRQFTKVIKDGIALVLDLMQGSTRELERQFPFVLAAIQQQSTVAPMPAPQKLSAGFIPIPTVEDEDDELNMAQSSQEANASNFMSAFAMMDS